MKKKTKKNNKDNNKLLMTIIAVALIIAIIGGSTFAYWSWQSSAEQKTNVVVTIEGATFTITGNDINKDARMYPTNDCDGNGALIGEVATATVVNGTESPMQAALKIRATLSANYGTLTTTNKGKLNWAIVDTSTTATCASTTYKGTFASATTNTDIDTGITFTAAGSATTTKTYRLYIWLDSSYTFTNTGDTISDPMQNLTINVRWSPASTLQQGF